MARFLLQADGVVYRIDTELEERVKALEETVLLLQEHVGLAASEQIAANLSASKAYAAQMAEAKAAAEAAEAEAKAAEAAAEAAEAEATAAEAAAEAAAAAAEAAAMLEASSDNDGIIHITEE